MGKRSRRPKADTKPLIETLREAAPETPTVIGQAEVSEPEAPKDIPGQPPNYGVIIGLPCYSTMASRTAIALAMQARTLHGLRDIRTVTGTYLHRNRELLLDGALDTPDATHLMFVDTDLMFPADGIQRLLAHNVDIVGANYNQRSQAQLLERGALTATVKPFGHDEKPMSVEKGLFKVRAVATGFMLIRLDAVRDMPRPWFFFGEDDDGTLIGEDIWFCDRAREYGLDVWCDSTLPIGHIGEWVF